MTDFKKKKVQNKMQVSDEGYIINLLKHGENSLIITVVSIKYGKITGFVKSGLTKKKLGLYQLGNKISFNAYARIEENIPQFRGVELLSSPVASVLTNPQKLAVLSSFCELCYRSLPDNEPLEGLIRSIMCFMDNMSDEMWLKNYAVFEFRLLYFLGIGLDLGTCAVTGRIDDLAYVSPKSGRAVCREAGLPYKDKLFRYPHFAIHRNIVPTDEDVVDLLCMTEFFLKKNFFTAHGLKFPQNRDSLLKILEKKKDENA